MREGLGKIRRAGPRTRIGPRKHDTFAGGAVEGEDRNPLHYNGVSSPLGASSDAFCHFLAGNGGLARERRKKKHRRVVGRQEPLAKARN